MKRKRVSSLLGSAIVLIVGLVLMAGCQCDSGKNEAIGPGGGEGAVAFSFDPAAFPGAKPWTSEDFKNDPDEFQFAVLGDRGGGASPLGTYERAMEQLNWMRPEFVMSVGDFVEGYTTVQEEMDEQWEEFEDIVAKLEMPFFHVRGNHDINMPLTRQAWTERRGPQYYSFRYRDVLFIALDTEDAERPMPENMEEDIATYNRLKKESQEKAMAFIIEWMKTPEAQEAFGHAAKVEFPEEQRAWFKKVLAENTDVRWTFVLSGTTRRTASRRSIRQSRAGTTPSSRDTRTTTITTSSTATSTSPWDPPARPSSTTARATWTC